MSLREQYEADVGKLINPNMPWVVNCQYNGSAPISASFQIKADDTGDGRRDAAELIVSASDVSAVSYRDVVIVDENTWHVMRVLSSDRYSYRLELFRKENPIWKR